MFSNGEFSIPIFVHDHVLPGVPAMKDKRAEISYTFEEFPTGFPKLIHGHGPVAGRGDSGDLHHSGNSV